MAKKEKILMACVCAAMFAAYGCDGDDKGGSGKCSTSEECGDTRIYVCDLIENQCVQKPDGHCYNDVKDSDESDVNCGGAKCQKCGNEKKCNNENDCGSGYCNDQKICASPKCENDTQCPNNGTCGEDGVCVSCADGVQNGKETDIDCGGDKCSRCKAKQKCETGNDCETGVCTDKICSIDAASQAKLDDLVINEVMSVPNTKEPFDLQISGRQCDFVEIVNVTDHPVNMSGLYLNLIKSSDDVDKTENYAIELSGTVQAKSAHLVVEKDCTIPSLPDDVSIQNAPKSNFMAAPPSKYSIYLSIGKAEKDSDLEPEAKGSAVDYDNGKTGISSNRSVDYDATKSLINTNIIPNAKLNNTPGYCLNGGEFSKDCQYVDKCTSGTKDGFESDVDCGGLCSKCANDKKCNRSADCESGKCDETSKTCVPKTCDGVLANLVINEVLGYQSGKFSLPNQYTLDQCEFVEIVNTSNEEVYLENITLNLQQIEMNNDGELLPSASIKTVALQKNYIKPKNVLVVHNCATELNLPEGAIQDKLTANAFTNGAAGYYLWLSTEFGLCDPLRIGTLDAGISLNRVKDGSIEAEMALHNDISDSGDYSFNASPGYCFNGGEFSKDCKGFVYPCTNTVKDDIESDTDCGNYCSPCENEKTCGKDSDCKSTLCEGGKCVDRACSGNADCSKSVCDNKGCHKLICNKDGCDDPTSTECKGICAEPPTCFDQIQNQSETDIDCGGPNCEPCDDNLKCNDDADCSSGVCNDKKCAVSNCVEPSAGDLIISELYNNAPTSGEMPMYNKESKQPHAEYIELVNLTDKELKLSGAKLKLNRTQGSGNIEIKLSKCVSPHQAVVISGKELVGLPEGVANIVGLSADKNAFTNTADYDISLVFGKDEKVLHEVSAPSASSYAGISGVISALQYKKDVEELTWHNELNKDLNLSPGYCTNGTLFINQCNCGNHNEDCGGVCNPCENGKKCTGNADCISGKCDGEGDNMVCTCGNHDEICGGSCAPCELGKKCTGNADCVSGNCEGEGDNKICTCGNHDEICGGSCAPCELGKKCNGVEDCVSGHCEGEGDNKVCTCGNHNETCGGACDPCENDKKCNKNEDCLSGQCEGEGDNKVCAGEGPAAATVNDLLINEVMVAENASTKTPIYFTLNNNVKQCKFIEIVNVSGKSVILDGCHVILTNKADSSKTNDSTMTGTLAAKGVLVIHSCTDLPLPSEVKTATLSTTNLSKTAEFTGKIVCNETEGTTIEIPQAPDATKEGTSMNLPADRDKTATTMIKHTDIENHAASASPGYCANGALFSNDCVASAD